MACFTVPKCCLYTLKATARTPSRWRWTHNTAGDKRLKWILIGLVSAVAAWYVWLGSPYISEADVRAYYQSEANWLDEGQPARLCAALDDQYVGHVASVTAAGRVLETTDKAQSCAAVEAFFNSLKKLNDKAGGGVLAHSDVTLQKVHISADRRTATVTVRSQVRVGTEKQLMMQMRSESTDPLVKRRGTVDRLRAEGNTSTQ